MKTKVLFRQWREGGAPLALFPEEPANHDPALCDSWAPNEGHGAADPSGCMRRTIEAGHVVAESMRATLEKSYGYDLAEVHRLPPRHRATRLDKLERRRDTARAQRILADNA